MNKEVGIIVIMGTATVACALLETILRALSKIDAANILNFASLSGLVITGASIFAKAVKVLASLGSF